MPDRLRAYAPAGYDGVECASIGMDPAEFGELTSGLGLDYVAMMFCDDEDAFRTQLAALKKIRPLLVNRHPGRDYFDLERRVRFFSTVWKWPAASMRRWSSKRTGCGRLVTQMLLSTLNEDLHVFALRICLRGRVRRSGAWHSTPDTVEGCAFLLALPGLRR